MAPTIKIEKEPMGYKERIVLFAREMIKDCIMGVESLSDETKKNILAEIYSKLESPEYIEKMLPIWKESLKRCEDAEETEERLAKGLTTKLLDKAI